MLITLRRVLKVHGYAHASTCDTPVCLKLRMAGRYITLYLTLIILSFILITLVNLSDLKRFIRLAALFTPYIYLPV